MPYIHIRYSDGEYQVTPISDEDADKMFQQGLNPQLVEDDVYEAWLIHMKQHRVFNTLWRVLDNQEDR